jgi:diguanylate cyclase (GGDEF)-like protein
MDATRSKLGEVGRPGWLQAFLRLSDDRRAALVVALCLALFAADLVTSAALNESQLYAVALLPLYRLRDKSLLWAIVGLAIVLSVLGYLLDPLPNPWDGAANRVFSVLVILMVAIGMTIVAKSEHRLRWEAMTDPLTGLLNRRRFLELSNREEDRSRRYDLPFSVLMVDIDHFKRINDGHGHPVGDRVIQALADICTKALRPHDILARFGGEEFVLTLPQTPADGAYIVAERIRRMVEVCAVETDNASVGFTVSIGMSSYEKGQRFDQVVARADQALYEAKHGGRNRVVGLPPEPRGATGDETKDETGLAA